MTLYSSHMPTTRPFVRCLAFCLLLFQGLPATAALAERWTGTMSCEVLRPAPGVAAHGDAFRAPVDLTVAGDVATLNRSFSTGSERLVGSLVSSGAVVLEGNGRSNSDSWNTAGTLRSIGSGLDGAFEMVGRQNRWSRHCVVSLAPEPDNHRSSPPATANQAVGAISGSPPAKRSLDPAPTPPAAPASTVPTAVLHKPEPPRAMEASNAAVMKPAASASPDAIPRPSSAPSSTITIFLSRDPETGPGSTPFPRLLSLSRDGNRVAVAMDSGEYWVYDTRSGERLFASTPGKERPFVSALAFSPDGKVLAVARAHRVELASLTDGATKTVNFDAEVASIAFSPDGQKIATASPGSQITALCVLRTQDGQIQRCQGSRIVMPSTKQKDERHLSFRTVVWAPDGLRLFVVTTNDGMAIFAADSLSVTGTLNGNGYYRIATPFLFNADGSEITSLANGTMMSRWSTTTGALLEGAQKDGNRYAVTTVFAQSLHWVENGRSVVAASNNTQPPHLDFIDVRSMTDLGSAKVRVVATEDHIGVSSIVLSESLSRYAIAYRVGVGKAPNGLERSEHRLQLGHPPAPGTPDPVLPRKNTKR
jgi:hypothetical protein